MSTTVPSTREPLFSVVTPCYGVARYLPAFIASIEGQEIDLSLVEVVMVDDGSVDGTLDVLLDWQARRPDLVRVVQRENGGQAAARNTGIEEARGTWITFPDPDDVLDPDYFSRAAKMIADNPALDMVATNRCIMNDVTGETTATHPLRGQFRRDGVYALRTNDTFFHGGAVASFMRLERLRESGLRFDGQIKPNFEDGHFCASYLLLTENPRVGFLTTRYHYRKRADGTSTLQNALGDPRRYTTVLRLGYREILERARATHGAIPLWLQNFVLYELNYYLGREDSAVGTLAPREVRDEFHDLVGQITALLDPQAVRAYRRTPMSPTTRAVIQHGWREGRWIQPYVVAQTHDARQGLVRLVYRWTGDAPAERLLLGDREVEPVQAKTRDVVVQGRVVLRERLIWVPAKRIRVELDGQLWEVVGEEQGPSSLAIRLQDLPDERGPLDPPVEEESVTDDLTPVQRLILRAAGTRRVRTRYQDAWVLMDRVHNADDSGEHLFRHLREHSPETNAWFVVEKGTSCWDRLRPEYGNRVVAHGSAEWQKLMLNAGFIISSHADQAVVRPAAMKNYGPLKAKFVFLQHGVIKDDLSGWLNARPIDLFITSTQGEYDSIVADHTPYRYGAKEVVLTGLPRFDMLTRASERFPAAKRDLILISPTWRDTLVAPLEEGSQRRSAYDWITETPYWQNWSGLMFSDELLRTAKEQGLTVALLPHPNMEEALSSMELPAGVQKYSFDGDTDVRELFARAAVLVTDYSSTAFNSAYIGRPVVYFQFDQVPGDESRHVGLPGYFDYTRDGFGPVTYTIDEAVQEVQATVEHGRESRSPWKERIDVTFPFRDDQNCARVTAEVKRMTRRRKPAFRT